MASISAEESLTALLLEASTQEVEYILIETLDEITSRLDIDNHKIFETLDQHDISNFIKSESLRKPIDKIKFLQLYKTIRDQFLNANPEIRKEIRCANIRPKHGTIRIRKDKSQRREIGGDGDEKENVMSDDDNLTRMKYSQSKMNQFASGFDQFVSDLEKNNKNFTDAFVPQIEKSLTGVVDSVYQFKMDRLKTQSQIVRDKLELAQKLYIRHLDLLNDATMDKQVREQSLVEICQQMKDIQSQIPPKLAIKPAVDWRTLQTNMYSQFVKSVGVTVSQPTITEFNATTDTITLKFELPTNKGYKSLVNSLDKAMPSVSQSCGLEFEFGINPSEKEHVDLNAVVWESVTTNINAENKSDNDDPSVSRLIDDNTFVITNLHSFTHYVIRMRFVAGDIVASDYSKAIVVKTTAPQFYNAQKSEIQCQQRSFTTQYPTGSGYGKEIISLHVGQCGINLGATFWETISREHRIGNDGLLPKEGKVSESERLRVYYDESEAKESASYKPRAIFCDVEASVTDKLQSSDIGALFHPDNFCVGTSEGHNGTWGSGHYKEGAAMIDGIMDRVRTTAEGCDTLQGFQLYHNVAGGTGGGLGTLICNKLAEYYPASEINTVSVMSDLKSADETAIYNSALSLAQLNKSAALRFMISNGAISAAIKARHPSLDTVSNAQMNYVLSPVLSNITSSFRYSTEHNCDLRTFAVNMTPFPQLSWFSIAHSPLPFLTDIPVAAEWQQRNPLLYTPRQTLLELMNNQLSDLTYFSSNDSSHQSMVTSVYYRGPNEDGVKAATAFSRLHGDTLDKHASKWLADGIKGSHIVSSVPSAMLPRSATAIMNNTGFGDTLSALVNAATPLLQKKTGLEKYLESGMDESEFTEAIRILTDLRESMQPLSQRAVGNLDRNPNGKKGEQARQQQRRAVDEDTDESEEEDYGGHDHGEDDFEDDDF